MLFGINKVFLNAVFKKNFIYIVLPFLCSVKIGYVSYATGDIVSVTDIMLSIWEVGEDTKEPPKTWTFGFKAGKTLHLGISVSYHKSIFLLGIYYLH